MTVREEMNQALNCLFIAVHEDVARDVREKVRAGIADAHATGLREGLRQAAARLEALIAGAANPTLRDFECLHAELLADAAPTEVTRG